MTSYAAKTREVLYQAFIHDVVNTSKAAAYSGMLMFFPALLVITTLVAQVEEGPSLVGETRSVLEQFLPNDTLDLVQSSILSRHLHSGQFVLSATCLSLFAGLGVMLSLMEGFRRAYRLPLESWTFWGRRARALLLVFIALIPLSLASLAIVFGHQIEHWMIANAGHDLRHIVIVFWRMVRWAVSFVAILAVLTALYHFGTRRHGALVLGRARRYRWHHHLVSGHARLRLVRNQCRQLHPPLRILRGRNCHSRLALHHVVQRPAGRGAERCPLLGTPESTRARIPSTRAGTAFPLIRELSGFFFAIQSARTPSSLVLSFPSFPPPADSRFPTHSQRRAKIVATLGPASNTEH
jgi:hypothetical protein